MVTLDTISKRSLFGKLFILCLASSSLFFEVLSISRMLLCPLRYQKNDWDKEIVKIIPSMIDR
jgi:hypothetical protein